MGLGKMRHLFGMTLALVFGAMVIWLAATALEQYALVRPPSALAQSTPPNGGEQRTSGEPRMF